MEETKYKNYYTDYAIDNLSKYDPDINKYVCLVCNHKTKLMAGLSRHILNKHTKEIDKEISNRIGE